MENVREGWKADNKVTVVGFCDVPNYQGYSYRNWRVHVPVDGSRTTAWVVHYNDENIMFVKGNLCKTPNLTRFPKPEVFTAKEIMIQVEEHLAEFPDHGGLR